MAWEFPMVVLVVQSPWVFKTIRWAGIASLVLLGVQSLRSAWRGAPAGARADDEDAVRWSRGFRQGFLCTITNPEMFVFSLSLLPQFVDPAAPAPVWVWLVHAWALPVIGCTWLVLVAVFAAAVLCAGGGAPPATP